ncbi:MAG: PhoPQ-activated pathogenicity [Gammaproteobacteria bacterium]|jgi:PhoPQ-activated pathogenicity-related protein|nr:PhoPQ-activated pathogenicity [Gammaproteobacteria bacterium]MBT3859213.1 PhoPQ-activated pathogenicity [Gammaproteobacteria bacterium]MBT3988081.1 PhoPQ-activated pathogenicity [Gammaproteobacteria bacterium]MBT4257515.1 PhoPQ-activated pathogenicity [Gammaproteobacteria bacterium]MBT4583012.1 PhoPQ-activated pathogenicity [Gammaproteobacteria bacterium]
MKLDPLLKLVLFVHFLLFTAFYSIADEPNPLGLSALDRYVRAEDSNYRYSVIKEVKGEDYTTFIVEMTSQKWLTEAEVNLPLWEHFMTITAPDELLSDIGFLTIAGGSKGNDAPEAAQESDVVRALETGTVVSTLYMVPNQPLVFVDDADNPRTEDGIIAYTWDKFLHSGDDRWPLRYPMTKSAVKAMDTVTDLMASAQGGSREVDQFVVAGGSKRGWTTWTTAIVDDRVVAIIPIVIDMLNVEESFKHHFSVYGAYSLAVADYVFIGNLAWLGTPEFASLMDLVEPYEFRNRLNLPKYLLNSTGDEFFLPDSWQFYWDDLVGEKHVRYVPNSNHSMDGTDVMDSVDSWYHAIVHNVSMPRYSWEVDDDGTITVLSLDKPDEVLLWQAHNPESRNFMQARIGRAYTSLALVEVEPGVYKTKLETPETGYTAYYIEMTYPSGLAKPFKFSSGVKIVPDVTEYEWRMAPDSAREQK